LKNKVDREPLVLPGITFPPLKEVAGGVEILNFPCYDIFILKESIIFTVQIIQHA
jgi:hypothetical protein